MLAIAVLMGLAQQASASDAQDPPAGAPAQSSEAAATALVRMTTYRLSGNAQLRPVRIGDDGVHTYIQWSPDQPFPAVFAVNARGMEEIVDGYMRADFYTLDQVYPRLIFRVGRDRAEARRDAPAGEAR